MKLEELVFSGKLSIRSYNACKFNGICDILDLLSYYHKHEKFTQFRNCGNKSNKELTNLCLLYENTDPSIKQNNCSQKINLENIICLLTKVQLEILDLFIEINYTKLSVRSQNAIFFYLEGDLKANNFNYKILLNESFKCSKLKNIGKKAAKELDSFIDNVKNFIFNVNNVTNDNELATLKLKFLLQEVYSISDIPTNIIESASIITLVEFIISRNIIFENNTNFIFKNSFKIYNNSKELSLESIAEMISMSKERVRQIRKKCFEELFDKFQFIKIINDDLSLNYNIDIEKSIIIINTELQDYINNKNGADFSKEFLTYLIYIFLYDKFDLVGNIEDVLINRSFNARNRHNWKHFYIVNKEITRYYDFYALVNDIDFRLNERNDEVYKLNIKSYVANFYLENRLDLLDQITQISEEVINSEFDMFIDTYDNLTFQRTSFKQAFEYAYEALNELGIPSKISDITKKIMELHPHYKTNDSKVRASLRSQHGFIPIGRQSIFGLKKWEQEVASFKGGTIRGIVYDYLKNHSTPIHISEITSHVTKYRPNTYERSIFDNIRADDSDSFIFFKNGMIGISAIKYDNSFIELTGNNFTKPKTWEERFEELRNFLNKNNKLPKENSSQETEVKLSRWYRLQIYKLCKGRLDKHRQELILIFCKEFDNSTSQKIINKMSENFNIMPTAHI